MGFRVETSNRPGLQVQGTPSTLDPLAGLEPGGGGGARVWRACGPARGAGVGRACGKQPTPSSLNSSNSFLSSLLFSSLEFSHTKVYEPWIRALLGTASQFCDVVVLKSRTASNGTTLTFIILRVIRRGAQQSIQCQCVTSR